MYNKYEVYNYEFSKIKKKSPVLYSELCNITWPYGYISFIDNERNSQIHDQKKKWKRKNSAVLYFKSGYCENEMDRTEWVSLQIITRYFI